MALFMASILAGGVTYFVYKRLRAASGQGKITQIVAASGELPAGITLASKDVTLVNWPTDLPLTGSFAKTDAVVGRPLIVPVQAKEPILERDLAVPGAGIGLSAKIPEGMRATAVHSNEVVGVAGFLYPGSHVDVLATYNPPGGLSPFTRTILQDVEVLTAGQTIEPDPQGKPQTVNVVTLLLNPEDSQKLLLTSAQGTIQFVLRNGADKKQVEIEPTRMDQLMGYAKPLEVPHSVASNAGRPRGKGVNPLPTAPAPRQPYVLEVIQGNQRAEQKFPE